MNFAQVMAQAESENRTDLVENLRNFVTAELGLKNASSTHEREVFLRQARQIAGVLKAPPLNLSIELLSDICDNLTGWHEQITSWDSKNK